MYTYIYFTKFKRCTKRNTLKLKKERKRNTMLMNILFSSKFINCIRFVFNNINNNVELKLTYEYILVSNVFNNSTKFPGIHTLRMFQLERYFAQFTSTFACMEYYGILNYQLRNYLMNKKHTFLRKTVSLFTRFN